jgi:hypothetical protein
MWSARYELTSNLAVAAAAAEAFTFWDGASNNDGEENAVPSIECKPGSK